MQIMMIIVFLSLTEQAHELSGLLAQPMQLGANDVHRVIIRTMPFGDVIENHSRTMLASVVIFPILSTYIYIDILVIF